MKSFRFISFLLTLMALNTYETKGQENVISKFDDMMVRISEIEIDSTYLNDYIRIVKEESEASVRLEPGVVSIFPMYQKENSKQIRILEIYANRKAYEAHLMTPHFQEYKTKTLKMVKSLELIDMETIDAKTMSQIFEKIE